MGLLYILLQIILKLDEIVLKLRKTLTAIIPKIAVPDQWMKDH